MSTSPTLALAVESAAAVAEGKAFLDFTSFGWRFQPMGEKSPAHDGTVIICAKDKSDGVSFGVEIKHRAVLRSTRAHGLLRYPIRRAWAKEWAKKTEPFFLILYHVPH